MRMRCFLTFSTLLTTLLSSSAAELEPILLPPPRTEGGRPLMQVLKDRQTTREFRVEKLPLPVMSDLLWAGFGINRPASAHRTAPSAMNSQEIDIYVATADGLFIYEANPHRLKPVVSADIRAQVGSQAFLRDAPVTLVFVADFSRAPKMRPTDRDFYSAVDTGYISQNIYLYCASEGLATVVHELSNRAALAKAMGLRPDQKIILGQAIGYPKAAPTR